MQPLRAIAPSDPRGRVPERSTPRCAQSEARQHPPAPQPPSVVSRSVVVKGPTRVQGPWDVLKNKAPRSERPRQGVVASHSGRGCDCCEDEPGQGATERCLLRDLLRLPWLQQHPSHRQPKFDSRHTTGGPQRPDAVQRSRNSSHSPSLVLHRVQSRRPDGSALRRGR